MNTTTLPARAAAPAPMSVFERYLTVWVFLCIVAGIGLGQLLPGPFQAIGRMEVAKVNIPVGLLIWVMVIPMLLKVDFGALHQVRQHWRGIGVTLFVNWAVKPFSMALLGWLFIRQVFAPYLPAAQIDSYIAGLILLAAAPCTAMVFVWSRLTNGHPLFTLSQVALNDAIMVFAFAPIVALLLGLSSIVVPWDTLLTSVVLYIVIPVLVAQAWRKALLSRGQAAFDAALAAIGPWSITAHAGAAVRLPGRGDPEAAAGHRDAGGADPDPGVLQLGAGVLAQPQARRIAQRGLPFGTHRRQQLLRAGGGRGHQPVRLRVRRGAGDRGGRADRGAGHAAGGACREPEQGLVRGRRPLSRSKAGPAPRNRPLKCAASLTTVNREVHSRCILLPFHPSAAAPARPCRWPPAS
jgi:arsenical-resistance protein